VQNFGEPRASSIRDIVTNLRGSPTGPDVAEQTDSSVSDNKRWGPLVERLQSNSDSEALEELYVELQRFFPYYFLRRLGSDHVADAMHNLFLMTVRQLRLGSLKNAECLMGFVHTIAYRYTCEQITETIKSREIERRDDTQLPDGRHSVESVLIDEEARLLLRDCLAGLTLRQREILERFYLREELPEQIMREMNLTATQYRLLKSRSKLAIQESACKKLKRPLAPVARLVPGVNSLESGETSNTTRLRATASLGSASF
jgi:RNA polymerase sigma-70 factor, ECF subfamily